MNGAEERNDRRFDDLELFAQGLGLDGREFWEIVLWVNLEAVADDCWPTLEERFAEMRRRLLHRALNPDKP